MVCRIHRHIIDIVGYYGLKVGKKMTWVLQTYAHPKKEKERIANIIVKSLKKKEKRSICVNYYLRNLLFKTSLNNT